MKTILWEVFVIIIIAGTVSILGNDNIKLALIFNVYPCYVLLRLLVWLIWRLRRDYRECKTAQTPLLSKTSAKICVAIISVAVLWSGYDLAVNTIWPTATVIDAETGEPIEGAIALAQWYWSVMRLPEGGGEVFSKAKESFSGKDGKVHIGGFWGLYLFSPNPSLTVYKPGYVIWDNRWLCPTQKKRTDFNQHNRTVKLLKFEPEAARWLKEYPSLFDGYLGPYEMHNSCYGFCNLNGEKLSKIFEGHEWPFLEKERHERVLKLKK